MFHTAEQIVDFRPEDATNGRSFAPIAPVLSTEERTALVYCETARAERAAHLSSVEIDAGTFKLHSDGSSTYETSFTTKNYFNLTLEYEDRSSFRGSTLEDVQIRERGINNNHGVLFLFLATGCTRQLLIYVNCVLLYLIICVNEAP